MTFTKKERKSSVYNTSLYTSLLPKRVAVSKTRPHSSILTRLERTSALKSICTCRISPCDLPFGLREEDEQMTDAKIRAEIWQASI